MHSQHVLPSVLGHPLAEAADELSAGARRFGWASAVGFVASSVAYAVPLTIGLASLPSQDVPIPDPWFSMMEALICLSAPFMVAVMVAIHVWAPAARKAVSLLSMVFMAMAAAVTCGVHLTIMVISHQDQIASLPWTASLLTFQWPSVPYALDILAWDFFFPISVLLAAAVFGGTRLTNSIRALLLVSGVLSLVGLLGPAVGNMNIRSIGIVGYAAVFPIAVVLLARLFRTRTTTAADL